jgi:hypothetical protein
MAIDTTGLGENERMLLLLVTHMMKVHFEGTEADKAAAKEAVASYLNAYPKEKREETLLNALRWADALIDEEIHSYARSH